MLIRVTAIIAFTVLIALPLILHVDTLPFRLWDESRLAANALEMHHNGNLIVTYYDGQPEMWNTKPPVMIWLQVAFIKLLGFNELAVRVPSVLAGLLTCLLLVYISKKLFNSYLAGAIASLVLVTTRGYVDAHAIRTGDYDGLLTLFTTGFLLSAFMLLNNPANRKWMNLFFIALVLSVLTKSVQPLVFLPGILIYFLVHKPPRFPYFKFFTGGAIALIVVGSYYITRELLNPGYLAAIWENELGGRYFNALEENASGPLYYATWLYNHMLIYWLWFVPVAFAVGYFSKDERVKNFTVFNFIVTSTYFIIISLAKTKLYWYAVPLFPMLSLQIAMLMNEAISFFRLRFGSTPLKNILPLAFVAALFLYPYYSTGRRVYHPNEYSWDNEVYPISYLMKDALHGKSSLHNRIIVFDGYDQHLRLYAKALLEKGQHINFKTIDQLKSGDTILVCQQNIAEQLEKQKTTTLLKKENGVSVYSLR